MHTKRIGLIVAVEISAVLKKYGERLEKLSARGFEVMRLALNDYTLYIVSSGAGEIAAAAATQYLISVHDVDMILNFGVVGGLTEEMTVARLALIKEVVHYDFDAGAWLGYEKGRYADYPTPFIKTDETLFEAALKAEPELKPVVCASGDKFIADAEKKRELHEEFSADICEMESAGILITANRSGVPCLFIKAVSDSIHGGSDEFEREIERCAEVCLDTLDKVIHSI